MTVRKGTVGGGSWEIENTYSLEQSSKWSNRLPAHLGKFGAQNRATIENNYLVSSIRRGVTFAYSSLPSPFVFMCFFSLNLGLAAKRLEG